MVPIGTPMSRVIFRLVGWGLLLGFFAALGTWLSSGDGLNWFTTASVVGFFTFLRGSLRRTVMPSPVQDWLKGFEKVFMGIRELIGEFNEEVVFRIAWAVVFGILIATLEQGVVVNIFFQQVDMQEGMKGLLSLPIVLVPTYFVVGLLTMGQEHVTPSWLRNISEGLREGSRIPKIEITGTPQVLVSALARGISSTLTRGLAMVVFPVIFGSWQGGLTVVLGGLLIVYAWDGIVAWHRKHRENPSPDQQPAPDTE